MQIRVTVDQIDYATVIAHYNGLRPAGFLPLEMMNRAEGGFQVRIPEMQNARCDANLKIRQLRWFNRCLVSSQYYIPLTDTETLLLFQSLQAVLGKDKVFLEYVVG